MNITKRLIIVLSICITCVGCDQSTKILATEYLPKNEIYSYLGDTFRIAYAENNGAFLGLGDNFPVEIRFLLFVVIVGIFLAGLFIYLVSNSKQDLYSLVGFSLVLAGGVSNFYDRATNNGAVVDFLNIGIGSLRTGIFNIADIAIMAGIVIVFFISLNGDSANDTESDVVKKPWWKVW